MRLRLFERVRRLAHPRAGWLRPRRDRAGETARHGRPWEARSRPGDGRGRAPSASPEVAGRHRRNSPDAAGPTACEASAGGMGPPWPAEPIPPSTDEPIPPRPGQPIPPRPGQPIPPWPGQAIPPWPGQAGPPWPDEPRSVPPPGGGPAGTGGPRGGGGSPPDGRSLDVSPRTSGETAGRAGAEPARGVGGWRAGARAARPLRNGAAHPARGCPGQARRRARGEQAGCPGG